MMSKYVKLAGGTAYLKETFVPVIQKNLDATWAWDQSSEDNSQKCTVQE